MSASLFPPARPMLRDLPLAARLTLSAFLIAVGVGYLSALVQLHFKQASPGQAMPTLSDVVARFAGKDWPPKPEEPADEGAANPAKVEGAAALAQAATKNQPVGEAKSAAGSPAVKIKSIIDVRCAVCHGPGGDKEDSPLTTYDQISEYLKPEPAKGQFHKLVTADEKAKWTKDGSMRQAFHRKSQNWKEEIKKRPEAELRAERETERLVVVAWLEANAPRDAYDKDAFPLPKELAPLPLTAEFRTSAAAAVAADSAKPPQAKPAPRPRAAKSRQIAVESLTQSTHAHLLSFSVLYVLTGLVFAFSSYPGWFRGLLAPLVLVVQVVDIACWWLARLDGPGVYFALAIPFTGGVVGLGLMLQITLSLFNMYGPKGKAVLVLLAGLALGGGFALKTAVLDKALADEKAELASPG